MTPRTVTRPHHSSSSVGERVELGRYLLSTGERMIIAQRISGIVRVSDVPAAGRGHAYLIERELEHDGYGALKALVADYLAQAAQLAEVLMAASPLERYLSSIEES